MTKQPRHRQETEAKKSSIKPFLADLGTTGVGVGQLVTIGLAIFATIPFILSFFLGIQFNHVLSGSMTPTFKTGDLVITQPAMGGNLQKGAVVGIQYGDTRYTHRVVEVLEDGTAITQGDANNTVDLYKPSQDDLWGEVISTIPQPAAGFIMLFTIDSAWWAQTKALVEAGNWGALEQQLPTAPWGFIVLAAGVFLFWWLIPDLIDAYKRRQEKKADAENDPFDGATEPADDHVAEDFRNATAAKLAAEVQALHLVELAEEELDRIIAEEVASWQLDTEIPAPTVNVFKTRPRAKHSL